METERNAALPKSRSLVSSQFYAGSSELDGGKMASSDGERFDSGYLSGGLASIVAQQEQLPMEEPERPKLMYRDSENIDSGYGNEVEMDDDDFVEADRVASERRTSPPPVPATVSPPVSKQARGVPRRPSTNHITKMRTGSPPLPRRVKKSDSASSLPEESTHSGPVSLPTPVSTAAVASEATPLNSLQVSLSGHNSYKHSHIDRLPVRNRVQSFQLEVQKHMHYFLPNREGDK